LKAESTAEINNRKTYYETIFCPIINGKEVTEFTEITREITDRKLGYRVHTVNSVEDAVEYLKENSVDLVMLDMIMDPGMDGLDTYQSICVSRPGQKAILASGFAETERVRKALDLGAGPYVKNPTP